MIYDMKITNYIFDDSRAILHTFLSEVSVVTSFQRHESGVDINKYNYFIIHRFRRNTV